LKISLLCKRNTQVDGRLTKLTARTLCYRCKFCKSGALYRLVYDDSYTDEYVVLRARKTYGERKYDIIEKNCEHSARWCKTGIHESTQMAACFTTAGKVVVLVCLRLFCLTVFFMLASVVDGEYVLAALIMYVTSGAFFIVYSLYDRCKGIRPIVPYKRRDTNVCEMDSARRKCADVTHRCCCCGVRKCSSVVLTVCCLSCFFCSLVDAFWSACRRKTQCGRGTICRCPPSIVIGLSVHVIVREGITFVGPNTANIYILTSDENEYSLVKIVFFYISESLFAYVVGELIGAGIEAMIIGCAKCCCSRSTLHDDVGGENLQDVNVEPQTHDVVVLVDDTDD